MLLVFQYGNRWHTKYNWQFEKQIVFSRLMPQTLNDYNTYCTILLQYLVKFYVVRNHKDAWNQNVLASSRLNNFLLLKLWLSMMLFVFINFLTSSSMLYYYKDVSDLCSATYLTDSTFNCKLWIGQWSYGQFHYHNYNINYIIMF